MKWIIISLIILATGGGIWVMADKKSGRDCICTTLKNIVFRTNESGGNGEPENTNMDVLKKNNPKPDAKKKAENQKKQSSEIAKLFPKANAIFYQIEEALKTFGLPTAEEIIRTEAEAARIKGIYYIMRDITESCFERYGLMDVLRSIVETAEYLPDGMREYNSEKQCLPIHVSVWNTSADTLERQSAKLMKKYEEFMALRKNTEPDAGEDEKNRILRPVRVAVEDYNNSRGTEITIVNLKRAVQAYPSRKNVAEELLANYGPAVTEEKMSGITSICEGLKELLACDAYKALESYELIDGEKITIEMDGFDIEIDPSTKAYLEKVTVFAEKIRDYLEKNRQ